MRLCIHTFKHDYFLDRQADRNQILYEASLGGRKAALGFGLHRIRTLVSMATDSSHSLIMGKQRRRVFSSVFDRILFILAGKDDIHKSLDEYEIRPDSSTDYGVSCP